MWSCVDDCFIDSFRFLPCVNPLCCPKIITTTTKKMYDAYFVDTLTEYGACFWCILAGYSVLKVVYGQSCIKCDRKKLFKVTSFKMVVICF